MVTALHITPGQLGDIAMLIRPQELLYLNLSTYHRAQTRQRILQRITATRDILLILGITELAKPRCTLLGVGEFWSDPI